MFEALGVIEYLKIPTGMVAADKMAKTSDIEIIQCVSMCPGKYVVMFKGDLSAVKSAIEAGTVEFSENVIDSFLLGNPSKKIYEALSGANNVDISGSIGIIEAYSVASTLEGADIALKTANVDLIDIRLARGMCGKSYFTITGLVAEVTASIEACIKYLREKGTYLDSAIIANPDKNFRENLY